MEVQQEIPREAIQLYDLYIHGEIPRREFMDRLNKFTVAGLALPAMVEALMPNYAAAQQVAPTDSRIKTELRDRAVAERQRQHQGAAGAAGERTAPPSCRRSWSSTRTAASTRTSRTSRGASRWPTSWRSRPTA